MSPPVTIVSLRHGWVDLERRVVHTSGREQPLTEREVQLLRHLAARPGRDVPREELLTEVWGYRASHPTRAVDLTISRLRPKIEPDPAHPEHLLATLGVGYRLEPGRLERPPGLPTNLPPEPGPLFGREALVEEAGAALAAGRIVTLHGPGGIGKSRVARAVARAGLAGRTGGVWWVEGGGPGGLLERVAAVLRVEGPDGPAGGGGGLGEALAAALRARGPTLLVLDGVEADAEGLRTLLAARREGEAAGPAAGLALLWTAYTPLGLAEEAPLAVPPLGDADAAALFAARARGGARMGPAVGAAVAGVPLAIELAAAWAHAVDPEELAAALLRGGDGLALPDPERPARHRSLQRCVEATLEHLPPEARTLVAGLALHRGPVYRVDADAHLGAAALGALAALVDAGVLRREGEGYRLLGPVRAVARGPDPGGAARATWRARVYAGLEAALERLGRDPGAGLARLGELEEDAAALWEEATPDEQLRLLEGMGPYWRARGPVHRLTTRQEALIEALPEGDPRLARVLAAGLIGNRITSRPPWPLYERAWRDAAEPRAAEAALCGWALRKAATDPEGALGLLDAAIPGARGVAARELELVRLGLYANVWGEDPEGGHLEDALHTLRDSPWHLARAQLSASRLVPSTARAERLLDEAEAVLVAIGDLSGQVAAELNRAEFVHLPRGDLDGAARRIDAADTRARSLGAEHWRPRVAAPRAALALAAGDLDAAWRIAESDPNFLRLRVTLARVAAERRRVEEAREHLAAVLRAVHRRGPSAPPLGAWVEGQVLAELGDVSGARAAFAEVRARASRRGATRMWPGAALLEVALAPGDPGTPALLAAVEELGVDDVGVRGSLPLLSAWVAAAGRLPPERLRRLVAEVPANRSALARSVLRHLLGRGAKAPP